MKLFIASDHAGFQLKAELLEHLRTAGHEPEDMGAITYTEGDDYPDFVTPLAERVAVENAREVHSALGIVIGGSGQGEAMCANKVKGIRATVFYGKMRATGEIEEHGAPSEDGYDIVRLPRRHNDANILSLGARFMTSVVAKEAVEIFLAMPFSEEERHVRRISKY